MNLFICPRDWTFWRERFVPDHMVSLLDSPQDVEALRPPWVSEEKHLQICFRDHEDSTLPQAPTREHIETIIAWLRPRVTEDANFLIHCTAGLGRSPAAGYIAWAMLLGPGREEEAFRKMVDCCLQTKLTPNRLVIDFADKILGCQGALIRPLRNWNRRVLWARSHW